MNLSEYNNRIDLELLSDAYKKYVWVDKHFLFGYPADCFPEFRWICSLESRFEWFRLQRQEGGDRRMTPQARLFPHLLREMVMWGGNQNGIWGRHLDGASSICVDDCIDSLLEVDDPSAALDLALQLPGFGLTYASKLLRFLRPGSYGALDSRLRKFLSNVLPPMYDGNRKSLRAGFVSFADFLANLGDDLDQRGIPCPQSALNDTGIWRPADLEMALFSYADGYA